MQKLTTNLITAMLLTGLAIVFWSQVGNAQSAQCPSNPYIVQAGDTMARIARKCGVTLTALRQANPQIININRIEIGDRINIPGMPSSGPNIEVLLANATYSMLVSDAGYITLVNGHAQRPGPNGQVEMTLMGPSAQGDVNGDGVADARPNIPSPGQKIARIRRAISSAASSAIGTFSRPALRWMMPWSVAAS